MKATGIVRRIDDLGRVVIPKEIRRTMRIKEGDPLEIYVDGGGEVVLKKFSPITSLDNLTTEYAEALNRAVHCIVLIADRDEIIAVSGASKSDYLRKKIGSAVETVMAERRTLTVNRLWEESNRSDYSLTEPAADNDICAFCIAPVIPGGDAAGAVILCTKERNRIIGETEEKLAETAAGFLGRRLE